MQALQALPEHLLLATLARIPHAHCLRRLPLHLHGTALRAHHPSIDAHRTLRLTRIDPSTFCPLLRTAATMLDLQDVCLEGETLPRDDLPLADFLQVLPGLTALNLRDTRLPSAALDSLSAALPTLRQLQSLDVSDNRMRLLPLRRFARALALCPTLRSLSMLRTTSYAGPTFGGGAVLARALPHLPRLSALRFGAIGEMP